MRLRARTNLLSGLSIKYFGRNQIEYGQCKGCKTLQRRGRSESQGAPVGSGAGGDPVQALFHRYVWLESSSPPVAIRCVIRLRRTFSNPVTTFARFKSCSDTRM